MSRSYESILDHIAHYLRFLSNTQSYWFTLNTSYDHGCHLANQFRLGPNDYKVLFIIAGLESYKQLHQRDERQCNNQPKKRYERGAMLVLLARNGSTIAQLVVSARNGWGCSDNDNGSNNNKDNNMEMMTMKTASTAARSVGINAGTDTAAALCQGSTTQGKRI